ncbi:MAG TPA: aspartate-semialdehyde dehydrogenase [Opitutales bacterium]|nr:aspartate-semialdehyde dehydrogenase [Opitutales bacterium]
METTQYKIGIVGATGAVGQELVRLLVKRVFPASEIRLLASPRSAGKEINYEDFTGTVQETAPEAFEGLDVVIFSASGGISKELAPEAVKRGAIVIDNSSVFRLDDDVPLVVPEINGDALAEHKGIVASPNCSTSIAMMGLYPLHRAFGLKRFFASTYQAVSGSGAEGMEELEKQVRAHVAGESLAKEVYPHQIAFNLIPQVDSFMDGGYTREELKMLYEGRKILGLPDLKASTTCVRVPVMRAHSMSINAEFERPVDLEKATAALAEFVGSEVIDDPETQSYPMPIFYEEKVKCGVGRIRRDSALENGLAFWIVGDQLWKGAALNAIQIAEALVERGLISAKVDSV